jgi:hypothetical protein
MSYAKFGRGLLWAEGESHRRFFAIYRECFWVLTSYRQRKALSPAFSNNAIRRLTSVFFDSSYKVRVDPFFYNYCLLKASQMKAKWDTILNSVRGDVVIDVEKWFVKLAMRSYILPNLTFFCQDESHLVGIVEIAQF